jgi:nucleotide-binding universal stress UspA family protein
MSGPVLLAYDGSESAATAIAVAGRVLRRGRAIVCHAWSGSDSKRATEVAEEGEQLARAAGFDATAVAASEGRKTWRALLEVAESEEASLIVAGAHGLSGIGNVVLGSVSTGLVHHSPVPVLVVPATGAEERIDGPLLLCYDGSEPAKRAIEVAAERFASSRALLLHLWESWLAEAPALAGVSGAVAGMAAELDEIADGQSADRCAEGVAAAERAGFAVEGLSERAGGPVWKAVLDTADQHSCATIVIGSRGLTGISAALGSVSNGVVHHSRRPVLVVPPPEEE